MATYRFRAQAALDLRRKQDEDAQRALGDARRATLAAQQLVQRAEAALADSMRRAREEEAQHPDLTRVIWYRTWMKRQRQAIVAAAQVLEKQRDLERAAAGRAMAARRRLRSLERLRDRAEKAFQLAERRLEQKELDQLGSLQYVARHALPEGA